MLIRALINEDGRFANKFINITIRGRDMAGGVYAIK